MKRFAAIVCLLLGLGGIAYALITRPQYGVDSPSPTPISDLLVGGAIVVAIGIYVWFQE